MRGRRHERAMQQAALILALATIAIGLTVIAGWIFELPRLTDWSATAVRMKFNAAVCLVLLGLSLSLQRSARPTVRRTAAILAGVATLIAAVTLLQQFAGWDFGIDNLVVLEPPSTTGSIAPGRMAPATAITFVLVGFALMLIDARTKRGWSLSRPPTLVAAIVTVFVASGYLFGVDFFSGLGRFARPALPAVVALATLCAGTILIRPGLLAAENPHGLLVRRSLAVVTVVPFALAWLHRVGVERWSLPNSFSLALSATLAVPVAWVILLTIGHIMEQGALRLELAQRAGGVGVFSWDIPTGDVQFSAALEELYGVTRGSSGHRVDEWVSRIHPYDRAAAEDAAREAVASGTDFDIEYRIVRPDGEVRWIHAQGVVTRNALGEPEQMHGTNTDITQRRLGMAALEASERRYRDLFEDVGVGILRTSSNDRLEAVNAEGARLFGYASPAAMRAELEDDVTRLYVDPARRAQVIRLKTENPELQTFESVHRRRDGSTFVGRANARSLVGSDGKLTGFLTVIEDISLHKRMERQVLDVLRFNQRILDSSPDGILTYDSTGRCRQANAAAARIVGTTVEELLKQNFRQLESWKRAGMLAAAEQALATRTEQKLEVHLTTMFGKDVWLHLGFASFFSDQAQHLLVFSTDISERMRAEEALRLSRQRLALHIEQTPLAVIEFDVKGCFTAWNPAAERIFGWTAEEALGQYWAFIVPESARPAFDGVWGALVAQRGGGRSTNKNLTKDGRTISCEWFNTPLVAPDGTTVGVASLVQDVTDRERAEQGRRKLQQAVETSGEAVFITDLDGIISYINPAFTALYGYAADEVLDLVTPRILKSGRLAPAAYEQFWSALVSGQEVRGEVLNRRKDGTIITVESSASPVLDQTGRITGFLGIQRDITERKRAEQELEASREQLRALTRRIQHLREEEQTHLSREIHDQIGQTLTAVQIDLGWLFDKLPKGSAALRRRARAMKQRIDLAMENVRHIALELRPPILDTVGLDAALEWLVEQTARQAGLRFSVDENIEGASLNPGLALAVYRIAQEALTNVVRHAGASHVSVQLATSREALTLEVSDDGRGLSAEEARNPRALGLLGMRERAAAYDGSLTVTGAEGEGTTVRLSVPLQR